MPSKPAVSYSDILNITKDLDIFENDRKLKKENNIIWEEACNRLNRMIKRHNLYIYILQNRGGILNHLKCIQFGCSQNKCIVCIPGTATENENENIERINPSAFDEYEILHKMAFGVVHHGIIQSICPRRFHLTYYLPEQMELFKDFVKYIDSTVALLVLPNVVTKVTMKNYTSGDIYLICSAANIDNEVINFVQTVTEKMELHFIINFCHSYLRQLSKDHPLPSVIAVQYVKLLLNAVSFAFNCVTFYEYNVQCYKFLLKQVSDLPSTLIQIDILSLIFVIDTQEYFTNSNEAVKKFYIQCIIYLSTLHDLSSFEETVISILVLILSPYQNRLTKEQLTLLSTKICTNDIATKFKKYRDSLKREDIYQIVSRFQTQGSSVPPCSDILQNYIEDFESKAIKICKSIPSTQKGEPNAYYNSTWYKNSFKMLLTEFPAWTRIIKGNDTFDSVSSCVSQHASLFNETPNSITVSEFLKVYIEKTKILSAKGRELLYNLKHNKKSTRKVNYSKNIDYNCLNYEEN